MFLNVVIRCNSFNDWSAKYFITFAYLFVQETVHLSPVLESVMAPPPPSALRRSTRANRPATSTTSAGASSSTTLVSVWCTTTTTLLPAAWYHWKPAQSMSKTVLAVSQNLGLSLTPSSIFPSLCVFLKDHTLRFILLFKNSTTKL